MTACLSSLQDPDVEQSSPVEGLRVALLHREDLVVQLLPGQDWVEVGEPDGQVRGPGSVGDDEGRPLSGLATPGPVATSGLNLHSQAGLRLLQTVSLLHRLYSQIN